MIVSDEAIVLRNTDYRETSLITRVYSKDHGKISLLSKGVKSPKKNLISVIQPLSRVSIEFYQKSSRALQLLKEASTVDSNVQIRDDIKKIMYGLSILEIIDKATFGSSADPTLYRLIRKTLDRLAGSDASPIVLFQFFQIQLIKRTGFMLGLSSCHSCQATLEDGYFDFIAGELACARCTKDRNGTIVTRKDLSYIKELSSTNINDLDSYHKNNQDYPMKRVNKFLDTYMVFHINGTQNLRALNRIRLDE